MHTRHFHSFNHLAAKAVFFFAALFIATSIQAQTCSPTAYFSYTNDDGEEVVDEEMDSYSGSAPVKAVFRANPEDIEGYTARYEWMIYEQGSEEKTFIHRFDEDIEYTFTQSGVFLIELKATFTKDNDVIVYPEEGEQPKQFSVSIAESHLEMPNAFSPGDEDDQNKIYKVKKHQSIVEFKATIFNRWGQKLYSWDDVNGGWDGKVNGRVVKNGVYFVNVVAKGADGRVYHIRKDVNVLTRFNEGTGTSGTTEP